MIYRSIGKYALIYFVVITALFGAQWAFNEAAVQAETWLATLNMTAVTAAIFTLSYAWLSAQPERHHDNFNNLKKKHLIVLGLVLLLLGLLHGAYQFPGFIWNYYVRLAFSGRSFLLKR